MTCEVWGQRTYLSQDEWLPKEIMMSDSGFYERIRTTSKKQKWYNKTFVTVATFNKNLDSYVAPWLFMHKIIWYAGIIKKFFQNCAAF